ncbi:adenylate cyclase [Dongia mobilis]|uniref:Adenylate cyclase n=2 Tax=Dongia mobilis TaxID=578943 RepID=A0A4R6WFS3_9PROT|nr:adenylate cyclase [Dongia mobilis]
MAGKGRAPRGWLGPVLAGLLGGLVALLHLAGNPVLERIEGITLDWRFGLRGPLAAPDNLAIIRIDDRTLAARGRWPLPRATIAGAIDRLQAAGAGAIGIDILMVEPENAAAPDGDAVLRRALAQRDNTVLAMAALPDDTLPTPDEAVMGQLALPAVARPATGALTPPQFQTLLLPIPEFVDVARIGHVNLLRDAGGTPREHFPAVEVGGQMLPSFPLLLAAAQRGFGRDSLALSLKGELRLPGDAAAAMQRIGLGPRLGIPLNFFGGRGTIDSHSMTDLIDGKVPPAALAGRIVLIGGTATALGDDFVTPFDPALPGVEILATAVANLMDDSFLRRSADQILLETAVVVGLALLAWLLGQAPGPRLGLWLNLALLLAWFLLAQALFIWPLRWLAVGAPGIAIILGAALGVASRMVRERRLRAEAERQRGNLARYVPPSLADALAERAGDAFDGREQMAAILFVDLQGFTSASEIRSPSETAHFLKDFHAQLEMVVSRHGGVIAQFLGDGAFILWGLPQPTPDDPARAVACARDMLCRLGNWQPDMTARIGVHFGPVAMAQLGGQNQLQLTAAGDTVNVASRLEAIAKEVGAILTLSDDMANALRALGRHDLLAGLAAQPARRVRGRDQLLGFWSASRIADLA